LRFFISNVTLMMAMNPAVQLQSISFAATAEQDTIYLAALPILRLTTGYQLETLRI
jgi:hypothetical protein